MTHALVYKTCYENAPPSIHRFIPVIISIIITIIVIIIIIIIIIIIRLHC